MKKMVNNDIFASRQSEKILVGLITSVEQVKLRGEVTSCAILFYEDYKVIIPVSELGVRDDIKVLRSLMGAEIDFIITGLIDEQKIGIGSRQKAMNIKRKINAAKDLDGKVINVKVTGVGRDGIYVEAYGVETIVPKKEVDYGFIHNLRDYAEVGDTLQCKVISSDIANEKLELSMKVLKEDPTENLAINYPLNSEHLTEVTNMQQYGIFLTFVQQPQVTVLCPIPKWNNFEPDIRDKYVVRIKRIKDNHLNGTLIRLVKKAAM